MALNQIKEGIIERISLTKYSNKWEIDIEFGKIEISSSSSQCESQNAEKNKRVHKSFLARST